jgi:NhaP-type Na+/H+ or K+/H+ antiporter
MVSSWFLVIGVVLITMAFASRWVARMPLSFSVFYLAAGYALGPAGFGLFAPDLQAHAGVVTVLAEVAVLISLFAVGLRLRLPLTWAAWRTPVKLASVTMLLTIAAIAAVAHVLLALPWPVALLLGAILAPTDPVLASEVQVRHPNDRDALRVALTAEGGLNDGAAFPFVMLALVMLAETADYARWLAIDVLWAVAGGLALGALCGTLLAHGVDRLRRPGTPLEFEEFLAFGLIAITYGIALASHTYGFIAVFVAGVAFARVEGLRSRDAPRESVPGAAETASRLLAFTTQCERLFEVALVLLIGAALAAIDWDPRLLGFAAAVIVLVRPVATWLTVRDKELAPHRRRLLAWFGVRGIGSVFYLAYALKHLGTAPWIDAVIGATLVTIALSIAVHGISATPLMRPLRRRSSPPATSR